MEALKYEVKQLINKLSDRFDSLPDGPVHPMDADLILSLLRQLYEKTEALRSVPPVEINVSSDIHQVKLSEIVKPEVTKQPPVVIPPVTPTEFPPVFPHIQPPVTPQIQSTVDQEHKSGRQESVINTREPETHKEIENNFKAGNEFTRDSGPSKTKPLPGPVDLFGTPSIADKLKTDTPSLNDRITTGRSDQTLADRIHLNPINDLKAAIGLNEKFQFINELFEGSAERYTEAINLMNSCGDAIEADRLYSDLKARYNWDEFNPAHIKLHDFVVRRYI